MGGLLCMRCFGLVRRARRIEVEVEVGSELRVERNAIRADVRGRFVEKANNLNFTRL